MLTRSLRNGGWNRVYPLAVLGCLLASGLRVEAQSGYVNTSQTFTGGTVSGDTARGGNGGPVGGGGGAGLGGALFIDTGAAIILNGVSYTGDSAIGGNGYAQNTIAAGGGGGGGGLGGGTGGNGGGNPSLYGGGGGGGALGVGNVGGNGGFVGGGTGAGGNGAGGGGAGGASANGGNYYYGSGGGGGGLGNGQPGNGQGGGGSGAFGGGGGGASGTSGQSAGNGGFGGGAGYVTGGSSQGSPGYGGGGASGIAGGGGAGFGGAIFLNSGGALTIEGDSLFSGNSVAGGSGAQGGAAAGSDIFLMSGTTLNLSPGAGNTITFADANSIADNGGAGATVVAGGGGTVAFNQSNSFSGGLSITNGVTVQAGNLNALGTGAVTVSGGTLAMGNGNHSVTIAGYTQTVGGTLSLNIAGTGNAATADLLQVSNSSANQVSLGGTLTVNLSNFTKVGNGANAYTFALVDTNAGYNGTFSTLDVVGAAQGLTGSLDYLGDDVFLLINQANPTFSLLGLTANQRAVLDPINASITTGNASPAFVALVNGLTPLSNNPASFGAALDELSPQKFGQFTSATAFNNASFATEQMDNYLANLRVGPNGTFTGGNGGIDSSGLTVNDPSYDPNLAMVHSRLMAWNAAPVDGSISDMGGSVLGGVDMKDAKDMRSMKSIQPPSDPWNFFVAGDVVLAQGFSQADVPHFDDNTESVTLGADYRLTQNFLVGLTATYGHTDATLDNDGSSATIDSYSPGFYASYADKGWYANATGNYLHNAYTQSRVIGFLGQTATSAPEGNEGVANLDGGYDFHHGGLTYGPLIGLQYTHLTVDGYNEGGSVADLSVNTQDSDSLRSRLGGRLSFTCTHGGMNFTPHLDASWQHEFMDQSRGISSQFDNGAGGFSVRTTNPSRDSALADAGLDAEINRTVTVFADYAVQAGQDNYFGQSVQAGVKIGF
jgi:uncharacterized protein YhjY with autotransporter beta-barrel domain